MERSRSIIEPEFKIDSVQVNLPIILPVDPEKENRSFIEANTVEGNFHEIKSTHLIPVFVRDNEPLISHADFISATQGVVKELFSGIEMLAPVIRLSHEIKGRVPSARDKPANQLEEHEKTIYYERMMFAIEIPGIQDSIDGNMLSLTVGGVKSYAQDSLYSKKGDEHFKLFVGFQNRVCTNLCVWSDGLINDLKVTSIGQLKACIYSMLQNYDQNLHLYHLKKFAEYSISEKQFALMVGKCRMYPYLPVDIKKDIPQLLYSDSQLSSVVKDYYRDISFCRDNEGNINLWRLYNLFTGANKSSYIDRFMDKSVNAFSLVEQIRFELEGKSTNWYLS